MAVNYKALVIECDPRAVCSRQSAKYTITAGSRVLARARSSRQAWKHALREIVKGW